MFSPVIRTFLATLIIAGFSFTTRAMSEEVIHSFHSLVEVASNGNLTVTETIEVEARGRQIKRGIFRDFPILFEEEDGRFAKVGFKLLKVIRDGKPEPHSIREATDHIRIYVGHKDVFLPSGRHRYEITYETDRQINFFDGYDELFWNVTGNFWDFPILQATATFILPPGTKPTGLIGFTGRYGSSEQSVKLSSLEHSVKAIATRRLESGEGLSVAIEMPEGSIAEPSDAQLAAWYWRDNLNMFISFGGIFLVAGFYVTSWWRVGRDAPAGVIVPRWAPPDGISPALVNYIDNQGLVGKGFDAISSAVLNLAVKGHLVLDKHVDDVILTANRDLDLENLPVGEKSILNGVVLADDQTLVISKKNGTKVESLQQKFASAMENEHRDRFYKHNFGLVFAGMGLSILVLVAAYVVGTVPHDIFGILVAVAIASSVIASFVIGIVRNFTSGGLIKKIVSVLISGVVMIFSLVLLVPLLAEGIFNITDPWPMITLTGIAVINILFFFLLGAPTALGRKKMDEIAGLKQYLTLAEKDRMNLQGSPDFSQQHYEELLPYAMALGVEKPWSSAFQSWLAAAVAAGAAASTYRPGWYSGRSFSGDSLSNTMSDFTNSIQSGFSQSMPVRESSSGSSGGGFSGGGGGGGGGGGW